MSPRSIRRAQARDGRRTTLVASAGAALGASVLIAPAADAATFTVTKLADDGSEGTLREEIRDANQLDGDDAVVFQAGLTGTIALNNAAGEHIEIYYDSLDIQGPGADVITVSGSDETSIFALYGFLGDDDEVVVSGLTLADGFGTSGPSAGAIWTNESSIGGPPDLTIANSVITGNETAGAGGAILTEGSAVTIDNSQIIDNVAGGHGGGIYTTQANADGSEGTGVVIRDSLIAGNTAEGFGGGANILFSQSDVVIDDSTFSGNSTLGENGGGLVFYGQVEGVAVTIDRSTFSGNQAYEDGGGIHAGGSATPLVDSGPVLIQNSTVSGNSAGRFGGGILSYNPDDNDAWAIRNSTIVDNAAGGTTDDAGGGIHAFLYDNPTSGADEDTLAISSTIVANNSPFDLAGEDFPRSAFVAGFDLIGSNAGPSIVEEPPGSNLFGVDPQLGPLANNGGPTQTHLPALSSPVVDKGIASGLATDQRGLARTGDLALFANAAGSDGTDIGSVEIQAADCQGQGALKIDGSGGDDTLTGTDGPDSIAALAGNDSADGGAANDCVSGDEGNDNVKGGAGADLVSGGAGKDKVAGGGGKDKLKGQAGKDKLKGGGGKDRLAGAGGKDKLSGGGGKDRLKGGPGKDKLKGGGGKDRFNCGGGKDKVIAQPKDKVSASCEKVIERG